MFAFRQVPHEQIAVRIGLKFPSKRLCVRVVTDGDKNTRDLKQSLFFAFLRCVTAPRDISPFSSAIYLRDDGVPDRLDFFMRQDAISHDLGSAQTVATVNQINL